MQWVASVCAHCSDHPSEADTAARQPLSFLLGCSDLWNLFLVSLLCSEPPGVKAEDLYSVSDLDCGVTGRLGPLSGLAAPLFNLLSNCESSPALVLNSFGLTWTFSPTANDQA